MAKAAWTKEMIWYDDDRQWENLPNAALLTIFRRIDLDERLQTIPLVSKSWRSVSEHPQCWSSMIPDSVPPEKAFIEKCTTFLRMYDIRLDDEVAAELTPTELEERKLALGVSRLETLIKKSGGGDAITSLYLSPFISGYYDHSSSTYVSNRDNVLRLIADCCPNLKHISFLNVSKFPAVDIFEFISKLWRLELIDFDYVLGYFLPSSFMQILGNCLPHLRGIRIHTGAVMWGPHISCHMAHDIAKYLPRLKHLNLARSRIDDDELASILSGCLELQYLNVKGSAVSNYMGIKASVKIPRFFISWGCSKWNYGDTSDSEVDSDVADMSDFDQEESANQETKLITYSYDDQTFYESANQETKLIPYSYDDQTFYRSKLEYCFSSAATLRKKDSSAAGCYEETYKSYDYQYYLLKDGRSEAFYRGRAKDRKRRQYRLLYGRLRKCDGRRSKLKPLIECKMPYADDLYVMPVCS